MSILGKASNEKSNEQKFKEATVLLDEVSKYWPEHGSYKLDQVYANHNSHFRKTIQTCNIQIERLLRDKAIVETGDLNLQLKTTHYGRIIKQQTFVHLQQEAELKLAQRKLHYSLSSHYQ